MPVIKHYYFDFPFWRAEVSRLALILGDVRVERLILFSFVLMVFVLFQVPFEDVRVKSLDEFKASGKAPFGQAPVLEVDGKLIAQTGAIARY